MINLDSLSLKNIDGIYYADQQLDLSYPADGNDECFQLEENSFWFNCRNKIILTVLNSYPPVNRELFDVGGGNGFVSKNLQQNGYLTTLIEPGINGARNACKRGVKLVVCGNLQAVGFSLNSLPSVGLFDVLEHIEDDLNFLKTIHSYLIEDGLIYLTVPALSILWSKDDTDAGHFRRYNLKQIKVVLETAGFSIQYSSYFFSLLVLPIFILRTLPSRCRFLKKISLNKKSEHSPKKSLLTNILNKIWNYEAKRVAAQGIIPFGTSIVIVARKI